MSIFRSLLLMFGLLLGAQAVDAKPAEDLKALLTPVSVSFKELPVPEGLAKQIYKERKEIAFRKNSKFRYASLFSAKAFDLNKDGKPEYFVVVNPDKANLSMHNPPAFIYQSFGSGYRPLLNCLGSVQLLRGTTGGYTDVLVSQHSSAAEEDLILCKFSSDKYKPARCFAAVYEDENRAKYTEQKCGKDCL